MFVTQPSIFVIVLSWNITPYAIHLTILLIEDRDTALDKEDNLGNVGTNHPRQAAIYIYIYIY